MRTRWSSLVALALAVPALVPALLPAQQGASGGSGTSRARVSVRSMSKVQPVTLNKVCSELASSPSPLVRAPEGRALLRFKKDLEGAAVAMELRGNPNERMEAQRMAEVRRGIDSLMQVVVRFMPDSLGRERRIVTMHRDSMARGESGRGAMELRMARGQVEATIRSLEPEIAALMGTAAARAPTRIPMPTGWMGVTLSKSSRDVPSPEGMLTYNCEYPVIEAVHAGSPAEKGGLLAGDTLLAYNGRDVKAAAVNLTTLLVPKRVVRVRVNRDGRVREVPLTIAPRPEEQNVAFMRSTCAPGMGCDPRGFSIEMDTLRMSRFESGAGGVMFGALGRPGTRVFLNTSPVPPAMPVDAMLRGTGMAVIAGAQLSVIDDEFAQALGIEPGVLVLRVLPGTPLADAGVRSSDVIRAVNGVPLREMQPLHRAFGATGAHEVKLTVSGKGSAPRVVTVRW